MNATLGSWFVALGLTASLLGVLNAVRGLATRSAVHLARTR